MSYEKLLSPGRIGGLEIKNRVVLTGMMMGVCESGCHVTERCIEYYTERARGGVGLIMTGVCRVDERYGASAPNQINLTSDRYIPEIRRLTESVHEAGGRIFLELQHPGRQQHTAMVGLMSALDHVGYVWPGVWDKFNEAMSKAASKPETGENREKTGLFAPHVLAPSAIPSEYGDTTVKGQLTHAMTKREIKRVVSLFGDAALRAKKAGADGVEVHAAHGYLLSSFLSPYTNRRTDEYGGSLENRARIIKEVMEDVRQKCGADFPVAVRLNVDEFYRDIDMPSVGLELGEGVQFAKLIESWGADAIDVSCGTYETLNHLMEPVKYKPGWRAYLGKAVRDAVSIPVICAGVIREPDMAERLLEEGYMDFVGMGRTMTADPYWVNKVAAGRVEDINRCISCCYCKITQSQNVMHGESARCALNPRAFQEFKYPREANRDGEGRAIVVIGAGPGGLTAARELALRGFAVTLLEKNAFPGGQINYANKAPGNDRKTWAIEDLTHSALTAGAKIVYGVEVSAAAVEAYRPYAVVVATGGAPLVPKKIPGVELPNVFTIPQVLSGEAELMGDNVAVIGTGLTGLETADYLAAKGKHVILVEMASAIGPGVWVQHYRQIVPELEKSGAEFHPSSKLTRIEPDGIVVECGGIEKKLAAESVVLSLGVRPVNALYDELKAKYERVYAIGDAAAPGRILDATSAGFRIARELK